MLDDECEMKQSISTTHLVFLSKMFAIYIYIHTLFHKVCKIEKLKQYNDSNQTTINWGNVNAHITINTCTYELNLKSQNLKHDMTVHKSHESCMT